MKHYCCTSPRLTGALHYDIYDDIWFREMHLALSPTKRYQIECHTVKAWLDFFWSNQFHSVARTGCLCGLSFVKVIQIRWRGITGFCLCVSVALKQTEVRSVVFLSYLKPKLWLCKSGSSKLSARGGSLQVQGQSELWLRLDGGGSAPSRPHPAPSLGAATVMQVINSVMCDVLGGSLLCVCVFVLWLLFFPVFPVVIPVFYFSVFSHQIICYAVMYYQLNIPCVLSFCCNQLQCNYRTDSFFFFFILLKFENNESVADIFLFSSHVPLNCSLAVTV